ncbi:MAG: TylF/MycF family methyltransferase [Roseiarcus sp.]
MTLGNYMRGEFTEQLTGETTAQQTEAPDAYLDLLKKVLTASIYDESAWVRIEAARSRRQRNFLRLDQFIKALARSIFVRTLRNHNQILVTQKAFEPTIRSNGMDWPLFGYTMVGHKRLDNLHFCINDVLRRRVPGDLIETGVWRGGSTIFMRAALKVAGDSDRTVWVADSFEGLPVPKDSRDGADFSHVEHLAVSIEQVRANFARFDLLDAQVRFLKGWFCDTLATAPIERLAVLRLDGDLYSSTMDALEALYPKVSPGGYVIVDDYGSWPECKRAVDEYTNKNNIQVDLNVIDGTDVFWRVES